ncbi:phosphatase PAP2 family protein [Silicimonas algicola]|uniref:PAP2 superfamily protein n=1 Tax=Silicimonas algicola TaxID=1826607 RepID=A0A316GFA8_9RHOB|nr:phosphatase PAP2 family protein [Silicimonas algicola]AZQ66564.1 phosphatase PAP2 family protein [Silicimonas algicola]PWK58905.1 PAP2 superfamily protein [Silicimonas algicola]
MEQVASESTEEGPQDRRRRPASVAPTLTAAALATAVLLVAAPFPREARVDAASAVLPLAGLACAVASGNGGGYLLGYAATLGTVRGVKSVTADMDLGRRPNGFGRGFPSSHSASAAYGASRLVATCLSAAPVARTVAAGVAALTGAGRIEDDHHDAIQVIAGLVFGLGFERLFRRSRRQVRARSPDRRPA